MMEGRKMQHGSRCTVAVVIIVGLQFSACQQKSDKPPKIEPAHVEHIEGTELSRVTLTARAAERLDIKTAPVREVYMSPLRKAVQYGAVLYDAHGGTWVYTSPEPLVFVRHRIIVDYIEEDLAVLSDGPPVGTEVVTVGAAELFGTEFEIGH